MPHRPYKHDVELLYFTGCPSHEAFLPHLRRLLAESGIPAPVELIEITSDDEAQRMRFLGSPTLRINGVDVEPSAAGRTDYGMQCRLYVTEEGISGTPLDRWVLEAAGRSRTDDDLSPAG